MSLRIHQSDPFNITLEGLCVLHVLKGVDIKRSCCTEASSSVSPLSFSFAPLHSHYGALDSSPRHTTRHCQPTKSGRVC